MLIITYAGNERYNDMVEEGGGASVGLHKRLTGFEIIEFQSGMDGFMPEGLDNTLRNVIIAL